MATDLEQNPNGTFDVQTFNDIVSKYLNDNDFEKLKSPLDALSREQRSSVINHQIDDVSPFFRACLGGSMDSVQYMVEECDGNIEKRCRYILESENFNDMVTPLWASVSEKHLEVVKYLVEHGARVNVPSSTNSTPVRCACFNGDYDMVKYLVENGADIHLPNCWGGTCLINSNRGKEELVEFLIANGACINTTDTSGSTALHFAIREGRLDLVKVFLHHGADYNVVNEKGDNAVQTAALYGLRDILEYLIGNIVISKIDVIHAIELYGTVLVEDHNDLEGALNQWKKAFSLRYNEGGKFISKCLPVKPSVTFLLMKEANSEAEYNALTPTRPDEIYMQSLMMRERILGLVHRETIYGLRYRGAVYADKGMYQRCVDLWKHVYVAQRKNLRGHESDIVTSVTHFTEVLVEFFEKSTGEVAEKLQIADVFDVLTLMVGHIEAFMDQLLLRPLQKETFNLFRVLLVLVLHVMNLGIRFSKTSDEEEKLNTLTRKALRLNARTESNETLLHLALNADNSCIETRFCSKFPSLELVRYLLNCCANPNVVDDNKDTPLHYCVTYVGNNPNSKAEGFNLVNLLLENGAHADMRNEKALTALYELRKLGLELCPLTHRNLQCLAAEVIVSHKLDFRKHIPQKVIPFIEMH